MTTAERQVELVRLGDLRANPRNVKRHDTDGIAESLDRFGLVDLPVVDARTGLLVAGHGRTDTLRARKQAGNPPPEDVVLAADGEWLVPAVTGWASRDDDEADAAAIALNRWVEQGGWDMAALTAALSRLDAAPGSLTAVGYSRDDLTAALKALEPITFDGEAGNAHQERNVGELADNYRGNGIRTLVFDYVLADYRRVKELAAAARTRHQTPGNPELLMALLRRYDHRHPA